MGPQYTNLHLYMDQRGRRLNPSSAATVFCNTLREGSVREVRSQRVVAMGGGNGRVGATCGLGVIVQLLILFSLR